MHEILFSCFIKFCTCAQFLNKTTKRLYSYSTVFDFKHHQKCFINFFFFLLKAINERTLSFTHSICISRFFFFCTCLLFCRNFNEKWNKYSSLARKNLFFFFLILSRKTRCCCWEEEEERKKKIYYANPTKINRTHGYTAGRFESETNWIEKLGEKIKHKNYDFKLNSKLFLFLVCVLTIRFECFELFTVIWMFAHRQKKFLL